MLELGTVGKLGRGEEVERGRRGTLGDHALRGAGRPDANPILLELTDHEGGRARIAVEAMPARQGDDMVARLLLDAMLPVPTHDQAGGILATVEDEDIAERVLAVDVADIEHQLPALLEIEATRLKASDLSRLLLLLHPDLMDPGGRPRLQDQRDPSGDQGDRHGKEQQRPKHPSRADAAGTHCNELAVAREPAQGHQQRQEKGRRQQVRHIAHDLEGKELDHQMRAQGPEVHLLEGAQKKHTRNDQHQDRHDRGEDLGCFRKQIPIDDSEHEIVF